MFDPIALLTATKTLIESEFEEHWTDAVPPIWTQNLQPKPDNAIALFLYGGGTLQSCFARSSEIEDFAEPIETAALQVRTRALDVSTANMYLRSVDKILSAVNVSDMGYSPNIAMPYIYRRISAPLPIGQDNGNPPRWEFTINYEVSGFDD